MTSGKMSRLQIEAKNEWIKGRPQNLPYPTESELTSFKIGFYMAYKEILTRKKLYRTFNLRWEPAPESHKYTEDMKLYYFLNNDNERIGTLRAIPHPDKPFKWYLYGECKKINFIYSEYIDINDLYRLKAKLKERIINEYSKYMNTKE